MKNLLLIFLIFSCNFLIAQPFNETILTNNARYPRALEVADLNNNGLEDLVIAGLRGIVWYQNMGDQKFQAFSILKSIDVKEIQIIDYNFNSYMDIIGVNTAGNTLFRLMNDGDQNFTYHLISDTLTNIQKIKAVDVDGDNDMDIFISVLKDGAYDIYLYENNDGEFISRYVDRVDYNSGIYVFDYNNNGYYDFLTKKKYEPDSTEEIGIMVNDGTNSFTETPIYEKTGSIHISHVEFTDINNSGTKDLIIADNINNEFYWLENTSSARHDIVTGVPVTSFLVNDFNGNGIKDIVYQFENSGNSYFHILEGDDSGPEMSFTEVNSYGVTGVANNPELININNDNLNDFAYIVRNNDELGLFINDGSFSFSLIKIASLESITSAPRSIRRVDLDQDGKMDILALGNNSDLIWFKKHTNGAYEQKLITSSLNNLRQFEVIDINNNGHLDIITASPGNHSFSIWYNDGDQNFTEQKLTSSSAQISSPTFFSITDLNNNGLKDFVVVGSSLFGNPRGIFWIRNEGDGNFSSPIPIQTGLAMMGEVITCDFDSNGWMDIVVANGQYSTEGLLVIKNLGNETFWVTQPSSTRAVTLRLGDIDNDGLMDFVTRDQENNDIVWFKNNGDFTFTEHTLTMDEPRDVAFEICDAGNNGITDIFFYTTFFGFTNIANFSAGILINDGDQNFEKTYYLQNQYNILSALALDIENDGDIDFFLGIDFANKISFFENLEINLADPMVSDWPVASDITYGETLANSVLTGGSAGVSGQFEFVNPAFFPNAGIYSAQIKFVPDDPLTYFTAYNHIEVVVHKAIPIISSWPAASEIEYGQPFSESVLSDGEASVPGVFAFDNPDLIASEVGVIIADVTFTPDDQDNYTSISGTVDVTVNPATPEVTQWPAASGITFGEPLSASILSGGAASVSGTFSFDEPAIIPDVGVYAADVTFTPNDSDNYTSVSGTVDVTVNKADQVIEWDQDIQEIEYGSVFTLNATASSGLPVTFISDNTDVAEITGNELEIVGYGVAEITAIQEGDQNYNPAPEVSKTINIIPTNITIYSISDFKVYPIPASDFITIESPEIIDYSYFIFDNSGQLVMQGVVNQNVITTINITNLERGSYYLIIEFNNTTIIKKIIKM